MRTRFTASDLKLLAMGSMAVDHAGLVLSRLPAYQTADGAIALIAEGIYTAMRLCGRMAFPLFAFLLVEGFLYTKDRRAYAARLGILAAVSEIPYNLLCSGTLFYPQEQNTVLLFFIGLLTMMGCEAAGTGDGKGGSHGENENSGGNRRDGKSGSRGGIRNSGENRRGGKSGNREKNENSGENRRDGKRRNPVENAGEIRLAAVLRIGAVILAGLLAAHFLRADYGAGGLLFILVLWRFRGDPPRRAVIGCAVLLFLYLFDVWGAASCAVFFFLNRYTGEKGRSLGRLPYLFYPLHLAVLAALEFCCGR